MKCFGCSNSKNHSSKPSFPSKQKDPKPKKLRQEVLLTIPSCKVHLMEEGQAIELATGDFTLLRIADEDVFLATTIRVGDELQWPLTKDEPVVKLDSLHYLFTLPMKDGDPLSYGVTFLDRSAGNLGLLDSFLKDHSCFSGLALNGNKGVDWQEFAPRVEEYNGVLAKAVAGGTGQIVKGIFVCSNAYTNQVQKGGETTLTRPVAEKKGISGRESTSKKSDNAKKSSVNNTLKRVRNMTKMMEKISKVMLDGVGIATGSVMAPVVRSQPGKAFLKMVPGEVLLASLDAVNKVLDAVEVAQKQTLSATSGAATRMVSNRFGENAGEATGDVLATAGHCVGTAWNIFKIRKAINPASSVSTGLLKNAAKSSKS